MTLTEARDRLRAMAPPGAVTTRPDRMGPPHVAQARIMAALPRVGIVSVLLVAASPALAQDLSAISTMMTTVLTALTGPIAIALAGLAFFFLGALTLMGRFNPGLFIAMFVGVVIMFGAQAIVAGFAT